MCRVLGSKAPAAVRVRVLVVVKSLRGVVTNTFQHNDSPASLAQALRRTQRVDE